MASYSSKGMKSSTLHSLYSILATMTSRTIGMSRACAS